MLIISLINSFARIFTRKVSIYKKTVHSASNRRRNESYFSNVLQCFEWCIKMVAGVVCLFLLLPRDSVNNHLLQVNGHAITIMTTPTATTATTSTTTITSTKTPQQQQRHVFYIDRARVQMKCARYTSCFIKIRPIEIAKKICDACSVRSVLTQYKIRYSIPTKSVHKMNARTCNIFKKKNEHNN